MQVLEQKLAKAQFAISTLQTQHQANREQMLRMANDIAELLATQEDMGCRLARLDEREQTLRADLEKTTRLVAELTATEPINPSADSVHTSPTYADELAIVAGTAAEVDRVGAAPPLAQATAEYPLQVDRHSCAPIITMPIHAKVQNALTLSALEPPASAPARPDIAAVPVPPSITPVPATAPHDIAPAPTLDEHEQAAAEQISLSADSVHASPAYAEELAIVAGTAAQVDLVSAAPPLASAPVPPSITPVPATARHDIPPAIAPVTTPIAGCNLAVETSVASTSGPGEDTLTSPIPAVSVTSGVIKKFRSAAGLYIIIVHMNYTNMVRPCT